MRSEFCALWPMRIEVIMGRETSASADPSTRLNAIPKDGQPVPRRDLSSEDGARRREQEWQKQHGKKRKKTT